MRVRLQLFAGVMTALLLASACGSEEVDPSAPAARGIGETPTNAPTVPPGRRDDGPRDASLDISDFTHQQVTVQVHSSVVWTNTGKVAHTTTSGEPGNQTGLWDMLLSQQGDSSEPVTFNTVGDFPFFCRFHNTMTGFITVVEDLGEGWGG